LLDDIASSIDLKKRRGLMPMHFRHFLRSSFPDNLPKTILAVRLSGVLRDAGSVAVFSLFKLRLMPTATPAEYTAIPLAPSAGDCH
jgi:hypothetical protein